MLSVCVSVLVLCAGGAAYDEAVTEITTEAVTETVTEAVTDLPVYVSDVICRECNCSISAVDCRKRGLRRPFEVDDWIGLRYLDITEVDLSRNHYISVAQLPELSIKKLNLSNCEIEILEDAAFSNLKDLAVLDLSRNKISFASIGRHVFLGILQEGQKPMPFKNLQYLSLAYNDIHSLSQDIFMFLPHLTFLDLSGNPLTFIDQVTMGALADLTTLKELRISECDLEILPEGLLRRQRRLERLDLSGNRFTTVPSVLSEAVNLLYLNFDKNPIQNLLERTAISNLTSLQELHLSRHSKLRTVAAGALGGLPNLVILYMKYNSRLTELDPAFLRWEDDFGMERWPQLKELYLNNNNLSAINSSMLDHWSQLTKADFSANPYSCDCSNQWMVDVLVPHVLKTASNMTTTKMVCRKPEEYRGMTFAQLYEAGKKLVCTSSESLIDASAAKMAVLYGILIGVLVTFPVVLMVVILWKNGFFARCRRKINSHREYFDEEETDAF